MSDTPLRCRLFSLLPSPVSRLAAVFRCAGVGAALMGGVVGNAVAALSGSLLPGQAAAAPAVYAQIATVSESATALPAAVTQLNRQMLYHILVAEFAMQRGLLSVAQEGYLELAYRTRDPKVIQRALQISIKAQDLQHALEMARLLTQVRPQAIESHRFLAQLLLNLGPQAQDEAVAELRWLIAAIEQQESATGAGFYAVSRLLSKAPDKAHAVDTMRRIVTEYQDNAYAEFALAVLLENDKGNLQAALAHYRSALALAPADDRILKAYVRALQRAERSEEALTTLTKYLEAHPESGEVRLVYARTLILADRNEQALEQLQQLLIDAPEDVEKTEVDYTLGLLLAQLERLDEAEETFKRLIYDPERKYAAWYHLAQIHEAQARIDDAIKAYQRVEDGQYRFNASIQAALLLADQGKLDVAREQLHQSEPRSTNQHVRARRVEGHILTQRELYNEAMAVYNQALALWPKNDKLLLDRAILAEKLDDIETLEGDLLTIIEHDPNHAEALNSLGYTLADRTDRYAEALEYIERAYTLEPDSYYIVDSMGWVMYRLGRYTEAIHFLRQALALYGKENADRPDQEIASHLGEVLWVTGNLEEAQRIWDKALQHYPDSETIIETRKRLSGS